MREKEREREGRERERERCILRNHMQRQRMEAVGKTVLRDNFDARLGFWETKLTARMSCVRFITLGYVAISAGKHGEDAQDTGHVI
jgi:hypothetical protein